MFRNKARLKGILGILIIAITIAGIYVWESYGRQELTYEEVIVFKQDVAENTTVTKEMLGVMQVEKSALIDEVVTDYTKIVGKQTNNFIPAKLILSEEFFVDEELANGGGNYTFKIPEEWIYSYPDTIRRGDKVIVYPIKAAMSEDMYYMDFAEGTVSSNSYDSSKPLVAVNVAYVKDSSNREVVNVGGDRYDASASVAQIEIITNEDTYNKLRTAYEDGYMFNLMYE